MCLGPVCMSVCKMAQGQGALGDPKTSKRECPKKSETRSEFQKEFKNCQILQLVIDSKLTLILYTCTLADPQSSQQGGPKSSQTGSGCGSRPATISKSYPISLLYLFSISLDLVLDQEYTIRIYFRFLLFCHQSCINNHEIEFDPCYSDIMHTYQCITPVNLKPI